MPLGAGTPYYHSNESCYFDDDENDSEGGTPLVSSKPGLAILQPPRTQPHTRSPHITAPPPTPQMTGESALSPRSRPRPALHLPLQIPGRGIFLSADNGGLLDGGSGRSLAIGAGMSRLDSSGSEGSNATITPSPRTLTFSDAIGRANRGRPLGLAIGSKDLACQDDEDRDEDPQEEEYRALRFHVDTLRINKVKARKGTPYPDRAEWIGNGDMDGTGNETEDEDAHGAQGRSVRWAHEQTWID